MNAVGPAVCLLTALIWAVAVEMFRRPIEVWGARTVNLAKCLIAAVLQGLTLWIAGSGGILFTASGRSLGLIAVSGLIGLVIGDTALFVAVARIGVHRTLLLQTLAPVFTAVIATFWLGEHITGAQGVAAVIILGGVALVVSTGRRQVLSAPARAGTAGGIVMAVLAALGQGSGLVLAKQGMVEVPFLPASFLRLATAAVGLIVVGLVGRRIGTVVTMMRAPHVAARVVPAAFLGTYLALFLMMAGISLAPASIAAVLLSTSPVFSLGVDAVVRSRRPSARELVGTLLAVAGVALLSSGI